MPSLRTLSLSGVVPKHASESLIQESEHLRHLQKLRLTGMGEQHTLLWHSLKTHTECAVQIEIVRSFNFNFPTILLAALGKHFRECDIYFLTELHVKRDASDGVAYDLFPFGQPPDECALPSHPYTHPYTHPDISLFVAWENLKKTLDIPTMQILPITPLKNMRRITIEAVDAARTEPERMARLADQRDVSSTRRDSFAFEGCDCMSHLRTITLKQYRLDHDVAEPALRDTLERRARSRFPMLEVLGFVGCGMDTRRVEEFELGFVELGLAGCIPWDGDTEAMFRDPV